MTTFLVLSSMADPLLLFVFPLSQSWYLLCALYIPCVTAPSAPSLPLAWIYFCTTTPPRHARSKRKTQSRSAPSHISASTPSALELESRHSLFICSRPGS